MEPVFLAQPVFTSRPISPLHFESFDPLPEDVILPGSSDEDSEGTQNRKRKRREENGHQYLREEAGCAITFKLKGPFEHGWDNPWGERGVLLGAGEVDKMRAKRQGKDIKGVRASSPIDLTSAGEEHDEEDKHEAVTMKRKPLVPANGWLTSNVNQTEMQSNFRVEPVSPAAQKAAGLPQPTPSTNQAMYKAEAASQTIQTLQEFMAQEDEEEELAELEKELDQQSVGRSPSPELEYSFVSQRIASRRKESTEENDDERLDPTLPETKPRLEKRALLKRLREVRSSLASTDLGADEIEILELETKVLEDRILALSVAINAIESAGTGNLLSVKTKRQRDQNEPGSADMLPVNGNVKRLRLFEDESGLTCKNNGNNEFVEQGIQVAMDQVSLHVPGICAESSDLSFANSSQSNEKARSGKAIRKARHKQTSRKRRSLRKLAREQPYVEGSADIAATNDNPRGLGATGSTEYQILLSEVVKAQSILPWKFSSESGDQELPVQQTKGVRLVENNDLVEMSKSTEVRASKDFIAKNTPERRISLESGNEELEVDDVARAEGHKVNRQVKATGTEVIGAKGEQVPIIIVEDYDSPASSSRSPSAIVSRRGWKPYRWLPGGQVYAERVLNEHLASIEAGGPSMDPFKTSTRDTSTQAREHEMQETKIELAALAQKHVIDLTDDGMPNAYRKHEPNEKIVEASNLIMQGDVGNLQESSRRTSVDSVNTAWRKDQSKIFDGGVNSNLNQRVPSGRTNVRTNVRTSIIQDKAQIARAKAPSEQFRSEAKRVVRASTSAAANRQEAHGDRGHQLMEDVDAHDGKDEEVDPERDRHRRAAVLPNNYPTALDTTMVSEAQSQPMLATPANVVKATSPIDTQQPLVIEPEKVLNASTLAAYSTSKKPALDTIKKPREPKSLTAAEKKSHERALHAAHVQGTRTSIRDLIRSTGHRSTSGSPHVAPASTNLSQFPYNRVTSAFKANSPDGDGHTNKQEPATPVAAKRLAKRRLSFTPHGHVKNGVEIRVPPMSSEALETSPTSIEGVTILSPARSSRPQVPQWSQGRSREEPSKSGAEALAEAQPVADKLPSGPSTNLLETDSQSLPSAGEDNSLAQLSTQAELAIAQQTFQNGLESPIKASTPPLPTREPPRRALTFDKPRHSSSSEKARGSSRDVYSGVSQLGSSSHELPSTQAMVDAMSPFAVSTVKKSANFLDKLTKPAAAIFGYMGWKTSQENGQAPLEAGFSEVASRSGSKEAALEASAGIPIETSRVRQKVHEPAIEFDQPPLNMETSDSETDELSYALSQPLESPKPRRRKSGDYNNYNFPDDDNSDFELTQKQAGLVRDDSGRWCNVSAQLSLVTPSRMTLRSVSNATQSQSQDGQRRSGLEEAIDEAESFLGDWDVKEETKKMGASSGVSGSGTRKTTMRRNVSGPRNQTWL
ncbi:hypothetical protein MMC13_001160 [Lambiella insularis]|nr:hypothetical protein [Lambiella insularis]